MPKKEEPAQSDTSRSTQSTESTGSKFANQSPASSKSSQSSSGLTGLIDTIAQKFSSASTDSSISKVSSDVIMGGLDSREESPDPLTSPETKSGFSLSPKGQPDVLKKKQIGRAHV